MKQLGLVTCLYDLTRRGALGHRSVAWLLEHGGFAIDFPGDLFVFTESELAPVIADRRGPRPTVISTDRFEDALGADRCRAIAAGRIQGNARRDKVSAVYVQLMHAKYDLVARVVAQAPDRITHLGWIDLAVTHVAHPPPAGVDVFADPPDLPRVHMLRYFDRSDTAAPEYHHEVRGHLAGGLVVGERARIGRLCRAFRDTAGRALARGLAPLDEGILTEVVSRDPDGYSYSYGDYCDLLANHDQIRGGDAHLAWEAKDAIARGGAAIGHADRIASALRASGREIDPEIGDRRPLLGLCMIVRDEAHGIAETLRSFGPHVDRWTILDTGSTDGTQDVIRQTLDDLAVPGILHEEPFVDFATSRNRALALHGDATRFTIMPDSDDRLIGGELLRGFLAARERSGAPAEPAYLANLRRGDLSYFLPLILRTAAGWRYHGRVHEHVGPPTGEAFAQVQIPGVTIAQEVRPQSREASRRRWIRDLGLLQAEIAARPDDPRALFYLAQTYECLGDPQEALGVYERRIAIGGWPEETFEAHLRRAKILIALGRPWPEVQEAYLDAHRFDPERAEPLFLIAEHWYALDAHALTYLFAERAAQLPRPPRTLFVDEDVYAWKAADLVAISGYYLGGGAKIEAARRARQCVRARPGDERIRANWAFHAPPAAQVFPGYRARRIDFAIEEPYVANNPSVYHDDDGWRCVVRTTNYRIAEGQYLTPGDGIINTRNFLVELDDGLDITRVTEMIDRADVRRSAFAIHGFEDCRLFRHRGRFCCTATVCDFDLERSDGPREIVLVELADDWSIASATALRGAWSTRDQKNWMPRIEAGSDDRGGETLLVYAASPDGGRRATAFGLSGDPRRGDVAIDTRGQTFFGHGRLRGGSQLVRVPGGWLAIVHDVAWPGGNSRIYLHRFVLFSDALEIVSLSDPFHFERLGVEFCAGLARDGDRLVASFGIEDCRAYLGTFDLATVMGQLRDDLTI